MTKTRRSSPGTRDARKAPLLGRKRVAFQWLTSLLVIGIPFVRIDGESLLRLDFGSLTLHAFGRAFPITDLSLFLLLCIALVLLFLLVTLAFGRAWCGWACPQTTLVDLVEWAARQIKVKVSAGNLAAGPGQKVVMQALYIGLSILVGANLTWYFVAPYEFFPQLLAGRLHWVAVLFMAIVAVTTYLDLAFLRRLFCKEFCPYGRFQTVLIDPGTLTLHYHPKEAPRCIQCGACVRSCPTGIDIRRGYQIECINCGRCLDACREVMARRQQKGIIRYTFGLQDKGIRALLNLRMALVAFALFGVSAGLVLATVQRDLISLKAGRKPELLPRITQSGEIANFYTVYLTNRTNRTIALSLAVSDRDADVRLSGATDQMQMLPGEKKNFDLALATSRESLSGPRPVELVALSAEGEVLSTITIYLTKPMGRDE